MEYQRFHRPTFGFDHGNPSSRDTLTSARAPARLLARRSSPERGSSLLPRPTSDQWLQIAALARTNSRYPAPSVAKYQKRAAGGWCHWRAAEACRRPGKPHPSIPSWRSSAASPSSLPGTLEVKAGGKTFPHTLLVPSTCPRPRPPPSPSSPVAGARMARPRLPHLRLRAFARLGRRHPFFAAYGRRCCPTSPSREVKEGGQCRA